LLARLPTWIRERLSRHKLQADAAAASLLAERVEGNLIAAAQEVEKLRLLLGEGEVTTEQIREAVVDSARFDPFQLAEAALAGETERALRILDGLRAEGTAPQLVIWALAQDVSRTADRAHQLARGRAMEEIMAGVWKKQQPAVQSALKRHGPVRWRRLLRMAARVEAISKGAERGKPWDALQRLVIAMASREAYRRFAAA
jgi:DNA polymerase III subunit delta